MKQSMKNTVWLLLIGAALVFGVWTGRLGDEILAPLTNFFGWVFVVIAGIILTIELFVERPA
jgi:hypothetical protein